MLRYTIRTLTISFILKFGLDGSFKSFFLSFWVSSFVKSIKVPAPTLRTQWGNLWNWSPSPDPSKAFARKMCQNMEVWKTLKYLIYFSLLTEISRII